MIDPITQLPRYQSHKVVRAAKILDIRVQGASGAVLWLLHPATPDRPIKTVQSETWCIKHTPYVGGYFVLYDDGYTSFSPAQAFEAGYTSVED